MLATGSPFEKLHQFRGQDIRDRPVVGRTFLEDIQGDLHEVAVQVPAVDHHEVPPGRKSIAIRAEHDAEVAVIVSATRRDHIEYEPTRAGALPVCLEPRLGTVHHRLGKTGL